MIQVNPLKEIKNKSVIFKIMMIVTKEIGMFIKALQYDTNHLGTLFML